MERKDFAKKVLRCSPAFWNMVLAGTRNLGFKKAKRAAKKLGTSAELWIDDSDSVKKKRRKAWDDFAGTD